jgi:tripartite-type tricarboxylate transporter receptor subunit TctC
VRIIVPTEAGGTADYVARIVAQKLSSSWTRGVVVENKPGAGGTIGAQFVAQAPADGYILGMFTTSYTTNAATNAHLPFDPKKDLVPVVVVGYTSYLLVCNPTLPVHSVADLIALAKKEPGKIDYASLGVGGSIHLATEMLDSMAGIDMNHVPFKGTADAVTATVSNSTQVSMNSLLGSMALARAHKLTVLAVTSEKRSPLIPDVPTIGETVPGYKFTNWFGILAPKGTPQAVIDKLRINVQRVLQMEEVKDAFLKQATEPATTESSAEFGDMIRKQIVDYSALAQRLDIHLQ